MAVQKLNISDFLEKAKTLPVLDVRSPSEFSHAHITGALSLPLFTDEQRKVVGTAYKKESREKAIKIGLDYFGPTMRSMVESVEKITKDAPQEVLVHCWRGGMRSGAVAWLLDLYGFKVYSLIGGYKEYRRWINKQFEKKRTYKIIGGYTGSAKTLLLHQLKEEGHAIIDLEGLANHRGSSLGGIGQKPQPSQEMFENLLGRALAKLEEAEFIFIEDESQRIGNAQIPLPVWQQMKNSTVYFLEVPFEKRLAFLCIEYGELPSDELTEAILRIQKRLGGLETKNAITFLESNDISACFGILLRYYDKWYLKGSLNKKSIVKIVAKSIEVEENSALLMKEIWKKK
ncbi:tRNA 2-selenouridine(34) synthase MnmH [Arcticibacterium luteifluviistationis]|uniref:tRNA 2-selenouridine(34) synthase MnmH n=1 Tax=Arcticibacterium luteifluviistationis TaxID=1784714 RepID=A0A2Z4GH72_9BACT|nr:tRNA 2-selenouridine(34) synthase MnmH [Arcticibacterium luteifluviistationis]AWW00375.1 tRNA 2-selenouridine(34) synthase MnmH [Arcticibacterium luteifluviistationis]